MIEKMNIHQPAKLSQPPEELIGTQNEKIFVFHTQRCGFDNRFISEFTVLGRKFTTIDQYFVWQKARYFGDLEIASEILLIRNPITIRRIGKRIREYKQSEWYSVRNKAN
ncbi:unnamed protein product [Meloidogyne enterolobii]|uniref:Uncharacterized protein n=1 Tax=Meloidogyne enterolobii TaxID=390850 RepID=A0ACB0YH47_MELEN